VSTTLSVADTLRGLGPRATSVFCMMVSSRILTALFIVVFAQRGFVATARLCATRCCSCQRQRRQAYSWQTKTAKQIWPMSQESKTIIGPTTWRNGASGCWHNQCSSELVVRYGEDQPTQLAIACLSRRWPRSDNPRFGSKTPSWIKPVDLIDRACLHVSRILTFAQ
jgi:hypothetical protein